MLFEILIISEDAFELHSGLRISNCLLEQLVQGRVKESCDFFQQICNHREQSLDEDQFQQSCLDSPIKISEGFVNGDDRVGYECQRTVSNLCIQVKTLAFAELQMLLCLIEEDFNIPTNLVVLECGNKIECHICGDHYLVLRTSSISADEYLHRNAIIFGKHTDILTLESSACREISLSLMHVDQDLG